MACLKVGWGRGRELTSDVNGGGGLKNPFLSNRLLFEKRGAKGLLIRNWRTCEGDTLSVHSVLRNSSFLSRRYLQDVNF